MMIAAGSDHAGFELKNALVEFLRKAGHDVLDLGSESRDSVDYPDYARKVADEVVGGRAERGLLVCGTGIGMSIAANRVLGIRAAVVADLFQVRMARRHNDANVLCLGARVTGPGAAEAMVEEFLATPFEAGRHQRRVEKMG